MIVKSLDKAARPFASRAIACTAAALGRAALFALAALCATALVACGDQTGAPHGGATGAGDAPRSAVPARSKAAAPPGTWQPIGPDFGTVLALARDPHSEGTMLVGTYFGGLYRSTDWGFDWRPVDAPFAMRSVFCVVHDRRVPGRVWVGTFQDGVWRSDDAGVTWSRRSNGLLDLDVQAVAVDPWDSTRVLAAGANGGVHRSLDAGATWAATPGTEARRGRALLFDPRRPGTVYLGSVGEGVWRSTDGGANWSPFNSGFPVGTVISFALDAAGDLYAASEAGVHRLPAGGSTWVDITLNLPKTPIYQVHPHPTVPGLLFAATDFGVYAASNPGPSSNWFQWTKEPARLVATDGRGFQYHVALQQGSLIQSLDFGGTWSRSDHGIQNAFVGALALLPGLGGGTKIVAGIDNGIRVDAGDGQWRTVLRTEDAAFGLLSLPDGAMLAGFERSGLWRSADHGETWAPSNVGLVSNGVSSFSRRQDTPSTVFAASKAGLFRSTDDGATWEAARLPDVPIIRSLAVDPVRGPVLYIGSVGGRVLRSPDAGRTFVPAAEGLPAEDIVFLAHAPWDRVFAITAAGGLYATADSGRYWYPSRTGCDHRALTLAADTRRNWVLYLGTAGGGVCKSESAGLRWAPANAGLGNPYVASLWVDPADPAVVYAGSVGRVYRSTDGAASWQSGSTGLPDGLVVSLQGSGADRNRLHAVVDGFGLYRSDDAGGTWRAVAVGVPGPEVVSVSAHPADATRLLVGTRTRGVLSTVDGGGAWAASNTGMTLFVRSMAAVPGRTGTVLAASLGSGVFRSEGAGDRWQAVGLGDRNVFKLVSTPGGTVLAGTSVGVSASADAGDTWRELGQRIAFARSLLTDPSDARALLVGGLAGELWSTADGGATWRSVADGLPKADVLSLARCPNGTVHAGSDRMGAWSSASIESPAWRRAGSGLPENAQILSIACDPRSGFVYAGTNAQGMHVSLDGGLNWQPIGAAQFATGVISAVVPSPTRAWRLWIALRDGGAWRSDDAGQTWSPEGAGLPAGGLRGLSAAGDGTLYAATAEGVYRLPPGSVTWSKASSGLPAGEATAVWADPSRVGRVVAATGATLHESSDAGASWSPRGGDLSVSVAALAGAGERVWVGSLGEGVVWSDTPGGAFSAAQRPDAIPRLVTALAIDAGSARTLYAATGGQGVLVSRDGGARWERPEGAIRSAFLLSLVADPSVPGLLYAGTAGGGVFVSRDGARSWTALNAGLLNRTVTSLVTDPNAPGTLYAGTEGGGIFRLVDPLR